MLPIYFCVLSLKVQAFNAAKIVRSNSKTKWSRIQLLWSSIAVVAQSISPYTDLLATLMRNSCVKNYFQAAVDASGAASM
jgi:hypothetical protein